MREGQRGRRQQIMQRGLNLRPAHGRREFAHFLRRLVLLSALLTGLNLAAAAAFSIFLAVLLASLPPSFIAD